MQVACIGECMIELREEPDGRFARRFGGDTLNTAVYLARLGVPVDYVTALGDDTWSDEMLAAWHGEGVGTGLVVRCPGKMPGLYVIQTDSRGERRFSYWRESAAARRLFALPEIEQITAALRKYQLIYYSGISLSLYGDDGRALLGAGLRAARMHGVTIAFDTNFRPRSWPDRAVAQNAFRQAITEADLIFASIEDLELLFEAEWETEIARASSSAEVVVKMRDPRCSVRCGQAEPVFISAAPVSDVVDTTAAGDSFAAAYIASRLGGLPPQAAAAAGHRLAGAVVAHPGAIIPLGAMPSLAQLGLAPNGSVGRATD
jgi:2-dehydro-3-deoxygluconokinase